MSKLLMLVTTFALFLLSPASADLFKERSSPVFGELQDGPISFCLKRLDTQRQMNAVIVGKGQESWDRFEKEGKCGTWKGDFMVYRLLSTGWYSAHGHVPLYLVELKLLLNKQLVSVYAFLTYLPRGALNV